MTAVLLALLAATGAAGAGDLGGASGESTVVRVGVLAYEDFEAELAQWRTTLTEIGRRRLPGVEFQIAVGNYGDLAHWMRREYIDVAVLTSGVFAESQNLPLEQRRFEYLVSVGLAPATTSWASARRRAAGFAYDYQSVCVVARESTLQSVADLRRAAARGEATFLFVHPLSVSGRIAPQYALHQADIRPLPHQVEYSHSHTESLRLAARAGGSRAVAAFVWDDALKNAPHLERRLRKLPFPELEALAIPHDVVAVRRGAPFADSLRQAMVEHTAQAGDEGAGDALGFAYQQDWAERRQIVESWRKEIGVSQPFASEQAVTLDDIGRILLHSRRSGPAPLRLAVVLSGGGAKCSYQIGAVCALEEKLAEINRNNPDAQLDIDLVVGTSGGAINSTPIALGVSRSEQGRADLRRVWTKLDQRDLVRPANFVRWNIGLWFSLVAFGAAYFGVRRIVRPPRRQVWTLAALLAIAAGLQLALAHAPTPWPWLGRRHLAHHAWLWGSWGWEISGWSLLAAAALLAAMQIARQRQGLDLPAPGRWLGLTLVAGLCGLPLIQLLSLMFFQESLSRGDGIESALAEEFPALVERHLARSRSAGELPGDVSPRATAAEKLSQFSRRVVSGDLLERDLVITGNCLWQSSSNLPSDLYFYHAAKPGEGPPFEERGVDLDSHPGILMDVVMGSGSIFPVFPPRTIVDFPTPGESIELIDGGFAHNSPLEAAVLWGATHVVLIEATPHRRPGRGNFVQNAAAAFTHLHKQTQNVDKRSRQQVVVFSLQPSPPHLCVLDFSSNLLEESIARGYRDAADRFKKEPGEPVFSRL